MVLVIDGNNIKKIIINNTMIKQISYPSIEQFRNVVTILNRQFTFIGLDAEGNPIYDASIPKPVITFKGTVKLHGTNAGISYHPNVGIWAQSRENIITTKKDNAGFAWFVEANTDLFLGLFKQVIDKEGIDPNNNYITIYGEWAGQGIQGKVGISNIPKSLFIFGVKISPIDSPTDSESVVDGVKSTAYWVDSDYLESPENKIYNITKFKTFEVQVDFNAPQLAQNLFVEITDSVEQQCPVSKELGFEGIGEGVVWSTNYKGNVYRFKVKGEKHAGASRVKTLKPVDDDKINLIIDTANKVTPVWRLEQMLEKTFDFMNGGVIDRAKMGDFIRLVVNDVFKEDSDIIMEAGLEPKDINKNISEIARRYFFEQETVR